MIEPGFVFEPNDLFQEFDARLVSKAIALAGRGDVMDMEVVTPGILMGVVYDGRSEFHPSLSFENQQLTMGCDCPPMDAGGEACEHALALIIAWGNRQAQSARWAGGSSGFGPVSPPQKSKLTLWPELAPHQIRSDWQRRLESLTVKDIRDLAEVCRVKLKGIKRDEVLNGMLDALCDPARLAGLVERLQPDTRRLLDLLCALWDIPLYSTHTFSAALQQALENGQKARPLKDCLAELSQFRFWSPNYGAYGLPLGLLALKLLNPALFQAGSDEPARVSPARPLALTRLALRLLLLAQAGRLSLNPPAPGGWPGPEPASRSSGETPIGPEPTCLASETLDALQAHGAQRAQWDLVARLVEALDLWRRPRQAGNGPSPASSLNIIPWLQLTPQEQSRRLWDAALALPSSLEMDMACQAGGFRLARVMSGSGKYADYLSELARARLRLGRLLSRVPAGQWISLESVLRTIYGLQPGLQLNFNETYPKKNPSQPTVWPALSRAQEDPADFESWRLSYGRFHQAILTGTFHWLGLLDLGYASQDESRPVAVRLTPFGEMLLGRRADYAAPPPQAARPLAIHPDGTLEIDPEIAPLELIGILIQVGEPEIEKEERIPPTPLTKGGKRETPGPRNAPGKPGSSYAPLEKGGKGGFGSSGPFPRTFRYRLSENGLGLAFDDGWTLDQIIDSLQKASGASLPAGLLDRMRPLWERYGRLQLYEDLALVQFADDYCLPELLASTRLSQILLYTFSPRLVAIRPEAAGEFLAELQSKGYTPRLEGPIHA